MLHPITHDNGKTDMRYTVTVEYTGDPSGRARFVLRFCDEYIGDYADASGATLKAINHKSKRMSFASSA